jgi:hypothetical protein
LPTRRRYSGAFWIGRPGNRKTAALPLDREDPFYTVEGIRANVPHFYEKTVSVMDQAGEISFGADFRQGGEKK